MKYIDNFLNKVTMYKLVLFGLLILSGISVLLSLFGLLYYNPLQMLGSFLLITTVCYLTNEIFARILKVQTNSESYFITALILFLTLLPVSSYSDLGWYVLAGIVAMASKYIFAINKKHIFNPAGVALVTLGLLGNGLASWWVGSMAMLFPTIVLGFLVLRKLKRFSLFFSFIVSVLLTTIAVAMYQGLNLNEVLAFTFLSGPIIFFGTIMLTEPMTTPPGRNLQISYGVLAGLLFSAQFEIGILYSTPALALLIVNIYSYVVSPRERLILSLVSKNKLSGDVIEFVWKIKNFSTNKLNFKAGQYLEWTLGHKKADMRGNRRFFTISSSPTEEGVRLGVKFYDKGSSFKNKLNALEVGDEIVASQLAGEFTLPVDTKNKLVFIAGGIGVTPFRSMTKNILDNNEKRDVVFMFSNKTPADIVYKDIFDRAEVESGFKNIYIVNEANGEQSIKNLKTGFITADLIKSEVPDYKERMFYISGSHGMVSSFETELQKMGVKRGDILVDFFPGFV